MNVKECIRFASLDLKFKIKGTIRTALCFFVLQFLIILWLLISIVLPRAQAELKQFSGAENFIVGYVDVDGSGVIADGSEGFKIWDYIQDKGYDNQGSLMFSSVVDMVGFAGMEERWSYINCDWLELTAFDEGGDWVYPVTDSGAEELSVVVCGTNEFYHPVEYDEYVLTKEDHYEDAMICGSHDLDEKELVIPDTLMKFFVDDPSIWPDLVGKKIDIKSKDKILISGYTLKGVYDHRLHRSESFAPIYIRCDPNDLAGYGVTYFSLVIYIRPDINYRDVCIELQKNGFLEFDTSDEAMFKVINEEVIRDTKVILDELVKSLGSVISVAVLFYLATTVYIEKKNKSPYIGILKAMGLENRKIAVITCFQQLILSVLAVIPSCIFAGLAFLLINKILESMVGFGLAVTWTDFLISSLIAISSTVVAGILLYLPAVVSYMRSSSTELLEGY